MRQNVVLQSLIIERIENNILSSPILDRGRYLLQKSERLLSEILVEHGIETGAIQHVRQRA